LPCEIKSLFNLLGNWRWALPLGIQRDDWYFHW